MTLLALFPERCASPARPMASGASAIAAMAVCAAALGANPLSSFAGAGTPSDIPFPTGRATIRSGPPPADVPAPQSAASASAAGTAPAAPSEAATAASPAVAPAPSIAPSAAIAPPPAPSAVVAPARIPPGRTPGVDAARSDAPSGWPKLVVAGGVHSGNPSHRMVIINGQPVREGAEPMPGLVVEQVRAASVVLNFRGQRHTVAY